MFRTSIALAAATMALTGCALHGAEHSRVAESAPKVSYVVEGRSYSLVASSDGARRESDAALRASSDAFMWLFNERPVRIGVMVNDTDTHDLLETIAMPASTLATVMVNGPASSAELRRALRFHAARAWLTGYAASWSEALDQDGVPFTNDNGHPVPAGLPDWMYAGLLRVLTAHDADATSIDAPPSAAMPLDSLFAYRMTAEQLALLQARVRSGGVATTTAERELEAFVEQSASVVRYLRATKGPKALPIIFGATMNGMSTGEVLEKLPVSVSLLEHQWRTWMNTAR